MRSICKLLIAITVVTSGGYYVQADSLVETVEVLSDTFTIDQVYKSMKGPFSAKELQLGTDTDSELLWITGYRAVMVQADGTSQASQEFMCHSNLDINMEKHRKLFGWQKYPSIRLFTLSQGQLEIQFPEGFGIPILSSETLSLAMQVLNLNKNDDIFRVRHKISIDFIRDRNLVKSMNPLFMVAANGLVLVEGPDGYYDIEKADSRQHGPGCLIGTGASDDNREDSYGRKFTGHWVVKPGREENHTLVTRWMNLSFDTAVHYIAVHLHPYAKSLELRDLTTDESIFKSQVYAAKSRIGIDRIEHYSSIKGIKLYKDHQYELISVYNNTTQEDQDSMAVMFLYVLDQEFQRELILTDL